MFSIHKLNVSKRNPFEIDDTEVHRNVFKVDAVEYAGDIWDFHTVKMINSPVSIFMTIVTSVSW